SLYGETPKDAGGGDVKMELDFIVNERVQKLIAEATEFLNGLPSKPAASPKIRDGGVYDKIAREVLEKSGLNSPVSVIKAQPLSPSKQRRGAPSRWRHASGGPEHACRSMTLERARGECASGVWFGRIRVMNSLPVSKLV